MLTPKSSPISSSLYQSNLGGDIAAVRGMVKALLEATASVWPPASPPCSTWRLSNGTALA